MNEATPLARALTSKHRSSPDRDTLLWDIEDVQFQRRIGGV
jgi:hypothetical protein